MYAWLVPIGLMKLNHRYKSLKDAILRKKRSKTTMPRFKDEKLKNLPKKKWKNYFEKEIAWKKKKKKKSYLKKNKFAHFLCMILKRFFS